MGNRIHYIEDAEVARLFDEECECKRDARKHLRGHPYFSFLTCDNDGDEEDEAFCNSFYRSLQD